MKVINEGQKPDEKPRKIKCQRCKSTLEFTNNDIQYDRDGSYVVCPVCNQFMSTTRTF